MHPKKTKPTYCPYILTTTFSENDPIFIIHTDMYLNANVPSHVINLKNDCLKLTARGKVFYKSRGNKSSTGYDPVYIHLGNGTITMTNCF